MVLAFRSLGSLRLTKFPANARVKYMSTMNLVEFEKLFLNTKFHSL